MAPGDYSSKAARRTKSFGELVNRIIYAPTSSDRDFVSDLAERFYEAETQERIEGLKKRNSRKSYDSD